MQTTSTLEASFVKYAADVCVSSPCSALCPPGRNPFYLFLKPVFDRARVEPSLCQKFADQAQAVGVGTQPRVHYYFLKIISPGGTNQR